MEQIEKMLEYTDEIWKLAFSKCGNAEDADDLVQDTYLAALTAVTNGKTIEYPRTWLANTLMHIWNSRLREKYRTPVIVTMDDSLIHDITEEELPEEEQVNLRNRIASLTKLYREVIVMHYIGGLSVAEIAERLEVPEGTVKRRLHDGRQKMKKEKVTSREAEEFTPMQVSLSWNGSINDIGLLNFANGHLIEEILACAYKAPVTLAKMSEQIGIPVYYLEDLVYEAVDKEFMIEKDGRFITDACLFYPDDYERRNKILEKFASNNREVFTRYLAESEIMVEKTYNGELSERGWKKLKRFFFIEMLQLCVNIFARKHEQTHGRPKRKDGGDWLLVGSIFPMGWEWRNKFAIGGHRNTGDNAYSLHEFDTSIKDSLSRYKYFDWVHYESKLIYAVYKGLDPISLGVPADMVENMEWFIKCGLFTEERKVDIPVMSDEEFDLLHEKCLELARQLEEELYASLEKLIIEAKVEIPSHIPEATAALAWGYSLNGIEMAVCYDLYEQGVHLKDVDYCCPPAVLVVR